MNRFFFVFLAGFMFTLVSKSIQNGSNSQFNYSFYYDFYGDVNQFEVATYFSGDQWLEDKLTSDVVDLNSIYQEKAFTRKLPSKSSVRRYQKSYDTWIEERICQESPFIDKPVKARMTSKFGTRMHPLTGRRHVHAGIDFRGGTGTPVLAASPGIIKRASRKGAYGKTIVIDHGNSYTTLYGHLSGYAVNEGQWVNQGQTIGYIGRTGRATGPHLHFEVRCHNVPLNPRKYLGKMGKIAEVKFKKRMRNVSSTMKRAPAIVKRDPNYYTRMINLKKLKRVIKKDTSPVRF